MTTMIEICHVHDISWDVNMDPPHHCDEEHDLLVFEEQELPFDDVVQEE